MENINFRNIPTKFELNGPILTITQHPVAASGCPGTSAIFTTNATATFPTQEPTNPATNSGTITYRWYQEGVGALTDGDRISGSSTNVLTINNLISPDDNGKRFYAVIDYDPSISTGNAINEPLTSDVATLTVRPDISIVSQPVNATVAQGRVATFNIGASLTDNSQGNLAYQWSANGVNLSDGISGTTVQTPTAIQSQTTASGFNGSGIYLDLTSFTGTVSVTMSTSEESGIFHYINIPGVDNIPENAGSRTYSLQGGRVYGPCSAPNGGLYIGSETPVGGTATLVVEEGGDDWNDMILYSNRGRFVRLNSAPTVTTLAPAEAIVTITDGSGNSSQVNLSSQSNSSYSSFQSGQVYTLRPSTDIRVRTYAIGGGGGTSTSYGRTVAGGSGGASQGEVRLLANTDYKIIVGGGANGGSAGYGGGGSGNGGGGGGGYTGIFVSSVSQSNSILIAGGGGGGGNDPAQGGSGGGSEGGNGGNAPGRGGTGGTQLAGGSGYGPGSALQGGSGAGGGGGGYFGGAGGTPYNGCCADGAGGGGSGYLHPSLISEGSYTSTNSAGGGSPGQNGSFKITVLETFSATTSSNTVSGARSPNLEISTGTLGVQNIRCEVSSPTGCNSPIFSNTVEFNVINARQILNVEYAPDGGSGNATLDSVNLFNTNLVLQGRDATLIRFYAAETDLDVFIDIYGTKGVDNGSFRGGEGGVSTIRLTMRRNEEFLIPSISSNLGQGTVFLYRKSRLIACVGAGGAAGSSGNGGPGGGVNVAGGSGDGRGSGTGGILYSPGTLPSNGIFGSLNPPGASSLQPGDSIATAPAGGRTLSCPKGYWYLRGFGACQDVGTERLYRANGNVVANSAFLSSGFKSGYGIRNTVGRGLNGGGNGGNGATGGTGGNGGGGGGGGSGYSDGSITIVSTRLGGHSGASRVIIRSAQ